MARVPMVIIVVVPVVWEVVPGGGLVATPLGSARLFFFVGLGLVFQVLRDDPTVWLGGDEDLWED